MFAGEVFPVDFKGEGFCLDKEGEGVPGRGARVHVKASVIDGELGALKRRAACTRVGPAASPEGIRTVSCSGALTFYGSRSLWFNLPIITLLFATWFVPQLQASLLPRRLNTLPRILYL